MAVDLTISTHLISITLLILKIADSTKQSVLEKTTMTMEHDQNSAVSVEKGLHK